MHRFGQCDSGSERSCTGSERALGAPDVSTLMRNDSAAPAWESREWKQIRPEWEGAELQRSLKINPSSFKAPFFSLAKSEQNKKEAEVSYQFATRRRHNFR